MAVHPANIKNTFMSHLIFWVVFLPVLTIVFLPLLKFDTNIDPAELQMMVSAGVDTKAVSAKVNAQFTNAFIRTGIMPASEQFFGGKASGTTYKENSLAASASSFAGDWIRGMWTIIYRAMWRFQSLLSLYIAALVAICVPAMIDGLVIRARKRYHFENSNPVFFYFSYHSAVLVVGLLCYLPLVPIALTPAILAIFLGALGISMWWAASHFQTGS